ncbi:MAG: LVIVD repeat-containing protein [Methanobacteriota archaeon]
MSVRPSGSRPLRPILSALSILSVVLAGCIGSSEDPSPSGLPELSGIEIGTPVIQSHDHLDASLHVGSANVRLVGYNNGYDGAPIPPHVTYAEFAVKGDYAYLGRVAWTLAPETGDAGGFAIIDVSDPTAPKKVGDFAGEGAYDLEVSDDGDWAFLSTQRNQPVAAARADSGPEGKMQRGTTVVDVSDKANPVFESFFPLPTNGPHTATYYDLDGRHLLVQCTYDLPGSVFGFGPNPPGADLPFGSNPVTQRVLITELVEDAGGRHVLEVLSTFQLPAAPDGNSYQPHDTAIQVHPVTGRLLMYVAYWDHGLVVVDITDPAAPEFVSQFTDTSPSMFVNQHSDKPFPHAIAGRHVTVMEPEIPSGPETSQLTYVDTTDPAAPKKLGYWTLPGELVIDEPFVFSPHNFDLDRGLTWIGHNHAGVWVIDTGSEELLANPRSAGYYFPSMPRDGFEDHIPSVWGVFVKDGLAYAADGGTGLYILEYTGERAYAGENHFDGMDAGHAH